MKISRLLLRPILDSNAFPLLFIIALLLLNLLSNALYDAAKGYLSGLRIIAMAVILLCLIVAGYGLAHWVRQRIKPQLVVTDIAPRRGLIVLVSQGRLEDIPATAAIRYHFRAEKNDEKPVLTHCWLVTSGRPPQVPDSKPQRTGDASVPTAWENAQALRALYEGKGIRVEVRIIDPEDPENIFQVIEKIYADAKGVNFERKDLVADFTGGTKMMSAGMMLTCIPEDRDLEYMRPRRFLESGRADPSAGADPKLVDLNFFLKPRKVTDEES
jgi:hypothetical protein